MQEKSYELIEIWIKFLFNLQIWFEKKPTRDGK